MQGQDARGTAAPEAATGGFRLLRTFTIATLIAFAAVAAVLVVLQRGEEAFFEQVQREQRAAFVAAQATLARQHEEAARASLLAVHEASHVNLTKLVGNTMWAQYIAPFLQQAQSVPLRPCPAGGASAAEARRACAAERGQRIRALPGFQALDARAYSAMHATSVFKIKVWDLRGMTIYSSEHLQIGDDGSGNAGWKSASAGRPASELTHRDRFSAFEGVVENRDLISSYVPLHAEPGGKVLAVIELYSDVTPFLAEIKTASKRFAELSAANESSVVARSDEYQRQVTRSSDQFLFIVLGWLVLLYGVGLVIVAIGQRLIDRQAHDQALAARREQLWHREKMAALATMAANVAHEVGNPLAVIAGVAQDLPAPAPAPPGESTPAARILEQTRRIAAMMRQISAFASARDTLPDWVDLDSMLKSVCDFHTFDRRFREMPIAFDGGGNLPACHLVPDHLNEVMMGLLQSLAESAAAKGGRDTLQVSTRADGDGIAITLRHPAAGPGLDACPRLPVVRRRVGDLQGSIALAEGEVRLRLPVEGPAAA